MTATDFLDAPVLSSNLPGDRRRPKAEEFLQEAPAPLTPDELATYNDPSQLVSIPRAEPVGVPWRLPDLRSEPAQPTALGQTVDWLRGAGVGLYDFPARAKEAVSGTLADMVQPTPSNQWQADKQARFAKLQQDLEAEPNPRVQTYIQAQIDDLGKAQPMSAGREAALSNIAGWLRKSAQNAAQSQTLTQRQAAIDTPAAQAGYGFGKGLDVAAPVAGLPLTVMEARNDARKAWIAEHPNDDAGAESAGDTAARNVLLTLPVYILHSAGMIGLVKRFMPEAAPVIAQKTAAMTAASAGNVAASGEIRAAEGQPFFSTESLPFDIGFGVTTGRHATAKMPVRPVESSGVVPVTERQPVSETPQGAKPAMEAVPLRDNAADTATGDIAVAATHPIFGGGHYRPSDVRGEIMAIPIADGVEQLYWNGSPTDRVRRANGDYDFATSDETKLEGWAKPEVTRNTLVQSAASGRYAGPTFATGATPEERAANFIEPAEDQPLPSAARFRADENVPENLAERVADGSLEQAETGDGGKVIFDPDFHSPDDFSDINAELQAGSRRPVPESIAPPYERRVDPEVARQAQREYEAELVRQAEETQGGQGHELLDAIEKSGGLPFPRGKHAGGYEGELASALESTKGGHNVGVKGVFRGKLFRTEAPHPDELATRLRDRGFDFQTPGDLFEALDMRMRTGKRIYGTPELASAGERPEFRRETRPRTPQELLPHVKQFQRALNRLARGTAIKVEVVKRAQLRKTWGEIPDDVAAAHLDGVVYMVHEALNSGDTLNRVNFLHEVAHSFERTLRPEVRRQLRVQWESERKTQTGAFYDEKGQIPSYVDQRVKTDFPEWFAEKVAWENHLWAKGEFDRASRNLIGRIAHDLRKFIQSIMGTLKPDVPTTELAKQFRNWMSEGAIVERGRTNAQFARRRSEPDMFAPPGREPVERKRRVEAEQFELPVSDQRRAPAPKEAPQFNQGAHADDIEGLGLRPEEKGGQQVLFARRGKTNRVQDEDGNPSEIRGEEKQADSSFKTATGRSSLSDIARRATERSNFVTENRKALAQAIRDKIPGVDNSRLPLKAREYARQELERYAQDAEHGTGAPSTETKLRVPIYRHDYGKLPFYKNHYLAGAEHARSAVVDAQIETGITSDHVRFARRTVSGVTDEKVKPFRDELSAGDKKEAVAYGYDAANTRAKQLGARAGNSVRLDFGSKTELADPNSRASIDDKAASLVTETGGSREEMQRALDLIRTSKDAKLAKEFTPIASHAFEHFDRLKELTGRAQEEMQRELAIERRAGMKVGEHQNYVTHLLEDAAGERELEPVLIGGNLSGGGLSRYFTKQRSFRTLAEAIHEGYRPRSISLSDLTSRRVTTGQRIVQQRRLLAEQEKVIADTKGPDGKRYIITKPEGNVVPPGYVSIDAAGNRIAVHRQYAGLFKALYGDSALRNSAAGRVALRVAAGIKHKVLFLDTYHVGRVFKKELGYGYQAGYNKGLSVLEYREADLQRAIQRGDLTQEEANYVRFMRPKVDELIRHGLNVGNVADNMARELKTMLTDIRGTFNDWTFKKFTRGAMTQVALTNFERNIKRFPELTRDQVARKTAKETNEVFGNLQSQGILKSKTMQDLSRLILLAPNWTESQLRAELRAYGQIARAPVDALRGRLRIGTVAQGAASIVLAHFAVNQLLNQIYRGKFTWQNDEDAHKLDAWIPGGKFGFWFNPFESTMEFTHAAMKYVARHEKPLDVALHIASNKLGPVGRSIKTMATGRDYAGRPFASTTDRIRASLLDLAPVPIPLSAVFEKDPRKTLGYRLNRQPGSIQKQTLAMFGERVEPEESSQQKMFSIAHDYRDDKSYGFPASPYTELRKALANDQSDTVKDEIRNLTAGLNPKDARKKLETIGRTLGLHKDGTIAPQVFAQNKERQDEMLRNLTPAQRWIYDKAQSEHRANALKFKRIEAELLRELLGSH